MFDFARPPLVLKDVFLSSSLGLVLVKIMDDIIDLYPVVGAPTGPPPSPHTRATNTLESLPRGIVDCPTYVASKIYNAVPVQTVESVADFQRDYDLADEEI